MPIWSKLKGLFTQGSKTPPMPDLDIAVPESHELEAILRDLERLSAILTLDGEADFVVGVNIAIDHLKSALAFPAEVKEFFHRAADTYRSMWGGMGSLTDFYIVNGSPEERAALGHEYGELIKRLNQHL